MLEVLHFAKRCYGESRGPRVWTPQEHTSPDKRLWLFYIVGISLTRTTRQRYKRPISNLNSGSDARINSTPGWETITITEDVWSLSVSVPVSSAVSKTLHLHITYCVQFKRPKTLTLDADVPRPTWVLLLTTFIPLWPRWTIFGRLLPTGWRVTSQSPNHLKLVSVQLCCGPHSWSTPFCPRAGFLCSSTAEPWRLITSFHVCSPQKSRLIILMGSSFS